jgi:preprotein translocase subunit SecF
MEFFKSEKISIMRHALAFNVISGVTFLLAVFFLFTKGLNFGVDFTGGTVMEVNYHQAADVPQIRDSLAKLGYHDVAVQNFGTSRDVLIRLPLRKETSSAKLSETVMDALRQADPTVELRRTEFVGPQVGRELVENGALALLFVSIGIVLYLWFRFEWKSAWQHHANLHDVVIILGFFAFFQWEFSLTVLAAVLAIFGYSVNESVVVFDRVRENFRKLRKHTVPQIIDNAITRTISRTIITHGSTQMAVLAMLFFGGETLHYFALALTIGIMFGIYSSALVASPIVMWLGVSREDLMPVKKETLEDGRP